MDFQQFVTTRFGTRLWMGLGKWLSPSAGHALARVVTWSLWRRKDSRLYRTIYANQAGVFGPEATPEQIDQAVRAVLAHAGMTAFDLMHLDAQGDEAVLRSVEFGAEFWPNAEVAKATGRGLLVCGGHLSNFNLIVLAFALQGIPVQVLSAGMAAGGSEFLHKLRGRGVLDETPIDSQSLRKALLHLRKGGVAATGIDWPLGASHDEMIPLFGRPARMPTGHIRLAMSSDAVLLPMACRWSPERGYYAVTAPHMTLECTGDRAADVQYNARRLLAVIENWIRETPDQWLMYHPVWPEGPEPAGVIEHASS